MHTSKLTKCNGVMKLGIYFFLALSFLTLLSFWPHCAVPRYDETLLTVSIIKSRIICIYLFVGPYYGEVDVGLLWCETTLLGWRLEDTLTRHSHSKLPCRSSRIERGDDQNRQTQFSHTQTNVWLPQMGVTEMKMLVPQLAPSTSRTCETKKS